MKASFRVENIDALQPGLPMEAVFSQRGGFIGSGSECTWRIQDLTGGIGETAARIMLEGNRFTIEPISGQELRINDARAPIPAGRPVILSDKDRVRIGQLNLAVATTDDVVDDISIPEAGKSLSTYLGGEAAHDALVINGELTNAKDHDPERASADAVDPLNILSRQSTDTRASDPMRAFDSLARARAPEEAETIFDELATPSQNQGDVAMGDQSDWHFSAMEPRAVRRDAFGFEEDASTETNIPAHGSDPSELGGIPSSVDHVALRPLSRALGIWLGEMSTEESQRLLGDIGRALRIALDGLNRIYKDQSQDNAHFLLSKMHLHALEDNPIQFSADVDDTLHAFFSKRGPVHLSAPAAVEETMEHLIAHQIASQYAIDQSLDTLMVALSPAALKKRFLAYEAEPENADQQTHDAWCWRMYRAYFNELRSERQRGLQMLFWEVFGHEYQQEMRRIERQRYLDEEDDRA